MYRLGTETYLKKEAGSIVFEFITLLRMSLQLCNFLDWRELKLVFKRYASLYFVAGVDADDNELLVLE